MKMKQLAGSGLKILVRYTSKSSERQILLQSTGLVSAAIIASYVYGKANYIPSRIQCAPISKFARFDASTCRDVPAVIVYPEPWLGMLIVALLGTIVVGVAAATLERSAFARYLLVGWLVFCALIAVSSYFNYSSMGQFPGAYFVVYPATPVIAFGVAAACIAAIANFMLRIRSHTNPSEAVNNNASGT
jgi:hypothetical protein